MPDARNPVAPFRFGGDLIAELVCGDPHDPFHRGRLLAKRHQLTRRAGSAAPQVRLLQWMLEQAASPVPYDHPMAGRVEAEPRPLSVGDVAFLESLRGVEPSQVSREDCALLHELDSVTVTATERRVVGQVADGVRRFHDRAAEELELKAVVDRQPWHSPVNRVVALQWVEDAMVAEAHQKLEPHLQGVPEIDRERMLEAAEHGARTQAREAVYASWVVNPHSAAELEAERQAAADRLKGLAWGGAPRSTKPEPPVGPFERGAALGQKRRAPEAQAQAAFKELVADLAPTST